MNIETRSVLLRPFQESDLEDLYAYSGQPGVGEAAGWRHYANLQEARRALAEHGNHPGVSAIVWKETGRVIGHIGIHGDSEGTVRIPRNWGLR